MTTVLKEIWGSPDGNGHCLGFVGAPIYLVNVIGISNTPRNMWSVVFAYRRPNGDTIIRSPDGQYTPAGYGHGV